MAAAAKGLRRAQGWRALSREGGRRRWGLQSINSLNRFCSTGMTLDNINKPVIDRIIRVDHAGEYGANRIYAGQMSVLGRTSVGPVIQQMWDQEKAHLKKFNELMISYRVRPSALLPFWNLSGFVLGAGTALLGREGAMACTVAVEASISEHYNNQIRKLVEEDPEKYKELLEIIKKFRDEELEHHNIGLGHDAELVLLIPFCFVGCLWITRRPLIMTASEILSAPSGSEVGVLSLTLDLNPNYPMFPEGAIEMLSQSFHEAARLSELLQSISK